MKPAPILFALLMLSAPARAEEMQIRKGQAVRLQPDKAYLLVSTRDVPFPLGTGYVSPVLYRVISPEEVQAAKALYEKDPDDWQKKATPNVVVLSASMPLEEGNGTHLMLVPVRPGTYILGGLGMAISWDAAERPNMNVSLCMGTVKFEAKPGLITDLGTVLAAFEGKPTDIPELTKLVIGKDTDLAVTYAVAVRPTDPSAPLPAALRDIPHVPADWRAVPAIPNYTGAPLARLAPLAGVLDYDKDGEVVDLKAQGPHAP